MSYIELSHPLETAETHYKFRKKLWREWLDNPEKAESESFLGWANEKFDARDARLRQFFAWFYEADEGPEIVAVECPDCNLRLAIEDIENKFHTVPATVRARPQFLNWVRREAGKYNTRNRWKHIYFAAATFASEVLGQKAIWRLPEIEKLAKAGVTLDELKEQARQWDGTPGPVPAEAIAIGGKYGESTRTRHVRGLIWELCCPHGHVYEQSTNAWPVKPCLECASKAVLDEKENARLEVNRKKVDALYKQWDKLTWDKVYKALRKRGIPYEYDDDPFAKELHARIWAKVVAGVDKYKDPEDWGHKDWGRKAGAWLGTIAHNAIQDYFKMEHRRRELAPMLPLLNEDGSIRREVEYKDPSKP